MKIQLQTPNSKGYLAIYVVIFTLFFCQFPLNDALPGNTDTWLYLGLYRSYHFYLLSLFSDVSLGQALYPSGPGFLFGDPCFFGALLFLPFKWLGMGDLWAWACMLVVAYSLNAYGAYLFFSNWVAKRAVAFWGGLALGASVFSFGNIDSPNVFYMATMFFCLHCSNRFLASGQWRYLLFAVVWGAATFYFSAYIFVFQAILLVFFWTYHYREVLSVPSFLPKLTAAVVLAIVLVAPFLAFLWSPSGLTNAWNPLERFGMLDVMSLDLPDLVRAAEGNLVYPILNDGLFQHSFFYAQHSVFPGILMVALAVYGYWLSPKSGKMWLILSIIGFILAAGPAIHINRVRITMPMAWVYEHTALGDALRNPVRLWCIVLIGLIGLTLPAIEKLLERPRGLTILILVMSIYIVENVPFKMPRHHAIDYVNPDTKYIDYVSEVNNAVVLELPSAVYSGHNWPKGLNEYSREYIYMYWQTMHNQHTVNGCNGFLPKSRLAVNDLICRLVDDHTLPQLAAQFGVSIVVFHKNLPLLQDDPRIEGYLALNPLLNLELETPNTTVYRINPQP